MNAHLTVMEGISPRVTDDVEVAGVLNMGELVVAVAAVVWRRR